MLVQLCYPYPRGVPEPAIYHEATEWIGGEMVSSPKLAPAKSKQSVRSSPDADLSVRLSVHVCDVWFRMMSILLS